MTDCAYIVADWRSSRKKGQTEVKQREPRQKVILSARLRQAQGWSDGNILNVSSRGLLLHASMPPARGSYLEIRRGQCVIVGRVVWVDAGRFGVFTQDRLPIDALIASAAVQRTHGEQSPLKDRRSAPRSQDLEWRYQKSHSQARITQFALTLIGGVLMALFVLKMVDDAVVSPMTALSKHLTMTG